MIYLFMHAFPCTLVLIYHTTFNIHCIYFCIPVYSRVLAHWLMLSVLQTTENKFYLYDDRWNVPIYKGQQCGKRLISWRFRARVWCDLTPVKYDIWDTVEMSLNTDTWNCRFHGGVQECRGYQMAWLTDDIFALSSKTEITYVTLNSFIPRFMYMITSSNGNFFRVTGVLCGEFTGHRWILLRKARRGDLMFSLICAWINDWETIETPVIWDVIALIMTSL